MVRGHQERGVDVPAPASGLVLGEPLGQEVRHALGHLAGVDEDERGAVVPRVLGDAVEDVGHLPAAHHRLELGRGELDGHVEVAGVAAVDDDGSGTLGVDPGQQPCHQVERTLGGRQADALEASPALGHQRVEPLEAQREMAAALVAGQRVHLVHDDGAHVAQQRPGGRGGQQQIQRLGCRHEEVG